MVAGHTTISPESGLSYASRDRILRSMGFTTYGDYLESGDWKEIRSRVMAGGKSCPACKSPASEVHHRSYSLEVLRGEKDSLLVPLCHGCHTYIEFKPNGNKRTLVEANLTLDEIIRTGRKPQKVRKPKKLPRLPAVAVCVNPVPQEVAALADELGIVVKMKKSGSLTFRRGNTFVGNFNPSLKILTLNLQPGIAIECPLEATRIAASVNPNNPAVRKKKATWSNFRASKEQQRNELREIASRRERMARLRASEEFKEKFSDEELEIHKLPTLAERVQARMALRTRLLVG